MQKRTTITTKAAAVSKSKDLDTEIIERIVTLATEGFTSDMHSYEAILRGNTSNGSSNNRSDKLLSISKENALTICDYIIATKREVNPRLSYIKYTVQFLSELSKSVGIEKQFKDMTRDDVLLYLDSCRKPENDDPLHKWIGTYNIRRIILFRFFKWLQYPDVANPDKRNELSMQERKPSCIQDIPKLKRKEVSCYKHADLWTQDDDLLFLKWVANKRDRCYHTMSRDLSARPHEILNLKIKDIVFKNANGYQYAEVLVNG
jgi:hypothetical protein